MMSSISEFRNANGTDWYQHTGLERILTPKRAKILAAEAGYIFTFAVAVVETAARSTLLLLSTLVTPISTDPMKQAWEEVKSSGFSIGWSFVDIIINPFSLDVATSEAQARDIFINGNLFGPPSRNFSET